MRKFLFLLAFLVLSVPASSETFALVQNVTASKTGGTGNAITLAPAATGSGNLLVVSVFTGGTNSVVWVVDDKGETWTVPASAKAQDNTVTGATLQFAYAYNSTANVSSVTVQCANTNLIQVRLTEWSGGQRTADPFDNAQHTNLDPVATSPTYNAPTITQSGAGNDLFISQIAVSVANVTGVGAPFTYNPYINLTYQGISYLISSDSSNHTPAWANPSVQGVTVNGISFKPQAGTASAHPDTMELVF